MWLFYDFCCYSDNKVFSLVLRFNITTARCWIGWSWRPSWKLLVLYLCTLSYLSEWMWWAASSPVSLVHPFSARPAVYICFVGVFWPSPLLLWILSPAAWSTSLLTSVLWSLFCYLSQNKHPQVWMPDFPFVLPVSEEVSWWPGLQVKSYKDNFLNINVCKLLGDT